MRALTVRFESGCVVYRFPASAGFNGNDVVQVFAEDYLLASVDVPRIDADEQLEIRVPLDQVPKIELPVELRTVLSRTGEEIVPSLTLPTAAELMQLVGPPESTAGMIAVEDGRITYSLTVDRLREFSRTIELRVNGTRWASAPSTPTAVEGVHEVTFKTDTMLRDGAYVELFDVATGTVLHGGSVTWMNLMGPILSSMRELRAEQKSIMSFLQQARSRLDALGNVSRDRQLLDRLDLFYFLLNSRLEKELGWFGDRLGLGAERDAAMAKPKDRRPGAVPIRELDGVGMYLIETNGVSEWRWLGPNVTLMARDVDPELSGLSLVIPAVAKGVNVEEVEVMVNHTPIVPHLKGTEHGGCLMTFFLPPQSVQSDRALIMHMKFARASTSVEDSRPLTIAVSEVHFYYK